MKKKYDYDIYLSYRRKDSIVVETLYRKLKYFFNNIFFDQEELYTGEMFERQILDGIKSSKIFLFILTLDSCEEFKKRENIEDWLIKEVTFAKQNSLPILPVIAFNEEEVTDLVEQKLKECIPNELSFLAEKKFLKIRLNQKMYKKDISLLKDAIEQAMTISNHKQTQNKIIFIKPQMVRIVNSLSIDMVKIPNKNYEMGKYPITVAEYMHFVKDTNSHFPKWMEEKDKKYANIEKMANKPITGISWYDAVAYCKWLSKKTGENYRLPTKAEWEYACRAETTTKWFFGDDESRLKDYAWYSENSEGRLHSVGKKLPNPWGLYDMYGNVWEWCEDDWVNHYGNKNKVVLGGSWLLGAFFTTSYHYISKPIESKYNHLGFRIVRYKDFNN